MKKVVETLFGYREPKQTEDFTHVIFTNKEYHENRLKISNLEKNIEKLEVHYKLQFEEQIKSENNKIAELQAQADKRIAEAHAETNIHKRAVDTFMNTNKNLIRIAKERANSQRGLIPKKRHIGYLFLNIEQIIYKIFKQEFLCYRIRLQSPYQVSFDLPAAEDLIDNDLLSELGEKMGITDVYENDSFDEYDEETKKIWVGSDNFIFKTLYKANFQKGFWQVEYLARYMVDIVPEMAINIRNGV